MRPAAKRRIVIGGTAILTAGLLALLLCPEPSLYGDASFSTAVTDRNGRLMRLALADDDRYRLKVPLDEIAPAAIDATLLYEDRYFRWHPGVNPAALMRAAWSTYVIRDRVMGASTITMQLARLRFDLDTRSIGGKLVQMARALQLERHYSKDEILEAYLNLAPYGGNIEGIGTAALIYFDKPASALTMTEAFALAVVPQNPVERDPSSPSGYPAMQAARSRLLDAWAEEHPVSARLRAQFALPLAVRASDELPFRAPHTSRALLADGDGQGIVPATVRATIDLDEQTLLERHVRRYVARRRSAGIRNASALLVDHRTMEVRAAVGSAHFLGASIDGQVDGTRAKRSPGSTLKPFLYGLAIDEGIIHPGSLLKDAPVRFAAYTPENFDRGFMGPITAKEALIYSRNVPAIELLSELGHETFHEFLVDAGVGGLKGPDYYGLAMILGGNELTMRELAVLYAMLVNGGVLRPLVTHFDAVTPVEGCRRSLADFSSPLPDTGGRRLMSREASFIVLDMLKDNPRPGALAAWAADRRHPIAWKTGTSYAFRDAWTVGVFGDYVLAVWVGNFDGSPNPAFVGRRAAAPLFFEIADALLAGSPADYDRSPPPDLNVRRIDICAATGDLPGRWCPRTEKAWFIPGVSPIRVSDVYRAVRVDMESGLRTCRFNPETTRLEVFEFWPSDILALFRKAGVAVRKPPRWADECNIAARANAGAPPRITSPSAGLTYNLRVGRAARERIPLEATTDSDVRKLYWFVNNRFVSVVERDEIAFWRPVPGEYDILAIDDLGRSHSQTVVVQAVR